MPLKEHFDYKYEIKRLEDTIDYVRKSIEKNKEIY